MTYSTGTYAKLVPTVDTANRIAEICNQINICNPVSKHDYHVTIVYSRRSCNDIANIEITFPIIADGLSFDIFLNPDKTKCLVLRLHSDKMHALHQICKNDFNASHDFETFNPHLTLSYDFDEKQIPNDSLIEFFRSLEFNEFMVEPLQESKNENHRNEPEYYQH